MPYAIANLAKSSTRRAFTQSVMRSFSWLVTLSGIGSVAKVAHAAGVQAPVSKFPTAPSPNINSPTPNNSRVNSPANTKPNANPNINAYPSSIVGPSTYPPYHIISMSGMVKMGGRTAFPAMPIPIGLPIETGIDGVVIYRFVNEIIKLHPSSRVVHGNTPETWMELHGQATVALKQSTVSRFVYMEGAIVRVNGTAAHFNSTLERYGISGERERVSYICLCYGQGQMDRPYRSDSIAIQAYHHNSPHLATPTGFVPTQEVIGHNDNDVVFLQSLLREATNQ